MTANANNDSVPNRQMRIAALGILIVFLVVNLWGLADYPAPHYDEVNHIALSYNVMHEGRFGVDHLDGIGYYRENFTSQGRLYQLLKGLWLELFGYRLVAGRLFSTLGWLIGVFFTYLVGKKLYDESVGIIGGLLYAIGNNIFYASHIGREELWVIAAGMGLFYFALTLRDDPARWKFALIGLLMAVSLDIHPNVVWFGLPTAALIVWVHYRTREGRIGILLCGLAGLIGVGAFIGVHLLPDPEIALAHMAHTNQVNSLATGSIGTRLVDQLNLFATTYFTSMNRSVIVLSAYMVAGLVFAAVRRSESDRLLLAFWGLSVIAFALAMAHKNPYYGILWNSLLALMSGAAVAAAAKWFSDRKLPASPSALALIVIGPVLIANLGAQVWLTLKFAPRDVDQYQGRVAEMVPDDTHVLADVTLWPALHNSNTFTSDQVFHECGPADLCGPLDAAEIGRLIDDLGIEIVVEDGATGSAVTPTAIDAALADYLQSACAVIGSVDDPYFGAYGQNAQGQPTVVYDCRY
ncbi:MAG: glycosyltransferase family 39 protein [Anaerolineae bacterium]|nr:glycosyltransferase family 39 protein [Anaerolineae bacterium]